jgi:hypothetical protein
MDATTRLRANFSPRTLLQTPGVIFWIQMGACSAAVSGDIALLIPNSALWFSQLFKRIQHRKWCPHRRDRLAKLLNLRGIQMP